MPSNFKHTPENQEAVDRFLSHESIRRISRIVGTMFQFYQPKMAGLYRGVLKDVNTLYNKAQMERGAQVDQGDKKTHVNQVGETAQVNPVGGGRVRAGGGGGLRPPYPGDPFASMSANGGRAVIARAHRDQRNLAMGLCGITPVGNFDHTKGGHIVLHEAKLIIQCPPGCTVYIPSATCTHYNLPLHDPIHETRASLIHFSSAGLFRWVEYEGSTVADLYATDRDKWAEKEEEAEDRVQKFLDMYMTLDEFFGQHSSASK